MAHQVFASFQEAEETLRNALNVEPPRREYKTSIVSHQDLPDNYSDWLTSRHMLGFGDPAKYWEAMGL